MNFDRDRSNYRCVHFKNSVNLKKFDFRHENLIFRQNRHHFRIAHDRFSITEKKDHKKRMENTVFT
jgi:hypothetical protein